MMLAHEDLRVVHVSTHVPAGGLRPGEEGPGAGRDPIANAGCKAIGIKKPKIGRGRPEPPLR